VSSPYLHAITCSKCGAALDAQPGAQILVCSYCQTSHVFAPPAQTAPTSQQSRFFSLPLVVAGAVLLVLGGALLAVRSIAARPSAEQVTERQPEAAPAPRAAQAPARASGPGDPLASYSPGQAVDIHWGSRWWPGRVLQKDGTRYLVTYEGWSSSWDEWVRADRLRQRESVHQ